MIKLLDNNNKQTKIHDNSQGKVTHESRVIGKTMVGLHYLSVNILQVYV